MIEMLKENWVFLVILGVAAAVLYLITEIAQRSEKKKNTDQQPSETAEKS